MENKVCFRLTRNKTGFTASLFMLASAGIRLAALALPSSDKSAMSLVTQFALPLAANILFIWCVFADKTFLSVFAVALGAVYFAFRLFVLHLAAFHIALCLVLYAAVLILYCLTVFGVIRVKWVFASLTGAALAYHIFVEMLAMKVIMPAAVDVQSLLLELSVDCIIAALFFACLSMEKRAQYN